MTELDTESGPTQDASRLRIPGQPHEQEYDMARRRQKHTQPGTLAYTVPASADSCGHPAGMRSIVGLGATASARRMDLARA